MEEMVQVQVEEVQAVKEYCVSVPAFSSINARQQPSFQVANTHNNRRIAGHVVFYAVHVIPKESR
jgi:hypothetical protein